MQFTYVALTGFGEVTTWRIAEVEVRVGKLKNGKAAGKDEITVGMIKGGLDLEDM